MNYHELNQSLAALIKDVPYTISNLANAAALLHGSLNSVNWAGFYILSGNSLILGPFQGKPACIVIPMGKGVCGTAAQLDQTQVVSDVHKFPGHIACDTASRSEIVIPLHCGGKCSVCWISTVRHWTAFRRKIRSDWKNSQRSSKKLSERVKQMERFEFEIPGPNGYAIPAMTNIGSSHSMILLCLHGFGGSKRSSVIAALMEQLDRNGIGVFTFDWPAHGDSPAEDADLTVENCLNDLDTVISYIRDNRTLPISCFATSFGGYLATIYRNADRDVFQKLILRSPALCMPRIFMSLLSESEKERLLSGEAIQQGFDRRMMLNISFYHSLLRNNPFYETARDPGSILILQGDRDDVVPPRDTAEYSERNSIRMVWFQGSDHRYKQNGDPEKIVSVTRDFLL